MDECQLSIKYRNIQFQSQNMTFTFVSIKFVSKHIFRFFMMKIVSKLVNSLVEKFDSWEIYFNFPAQHNII